MISHWLPKSSWSPARAMSRPQVTPGYWMPSPRKLERGLGQDDAGELEDCERGERREQVGEHVLHHHPSGRGADHLGGLDERSLPDREHDAAGHTGKDHPAVDGEDDADGPHRAAHQCDQQHREQQARERHLHVDPAHEPPVGAPALVPGDQPDDDAERAGERDHEHADEQRGPRAVDEARQDVVALPVGPHRVRPGTAVPHR